MTVVEQRPDTEKIRGDVHRQSFTARRPTDTEVILGNTELLTDLYKSRQDVLSGRTRDAEEVFDDLGW